MSGSHDITINSIPLINSATVRKLHAGVHLDLIDFGKNIAERLSKYVQKVKLTFDDELEVLIDPEVVVPKLHFLKDHHQA